MAFQRLSQKMINLRNSLTNNNQTYLELDESRIDNALYNKNNIYNSMANPGANNKNNVFVNPIGPLFNDNDYFIESSQSFRDNIENRPKRATTEISNANDGNRREDGNFEYLDKPAHQRSMTSASLGSNRVSPINLHTSNSNSSNENNGKRLATSDQSDSGFNSPARSLSSSGGKGPHKFDHRRIDLLKYNFQQIKKHAVSFKSWQCPKNIAVYKNYLAVSCRGRDGCINIFKIGSQKSSKNSSQDKNQQLRIHCSLKIMINKLPQEPAGLKFDNYGNLFVAMGFKIAQISNIDRIEPSCIGDIIEIQPDRLLGKSCQSIIDLNFVNFGHIAVTDDARGAISLINRDTGDKVSDYTANMTFPLRKPTSLVATNQKDLVAIDGDRVIFVDTHQNDKISCIFGGSGSGSQSKNKNNTNTNKGQRPTAIYCDSYNSILVATKERIVRKTNYRTSYHVESKLVVMTVNGQVRINDLMREKSILGVSSGAPSDVWDDLPVFVDIAVAEDCLYLLGEDKMIHIYGMVRI